MSLVSFSARMKGVGQVQEIAQDLSPVLARDALRVELHPKDRAVAVRNAHDEPVVAFRADLEFSRGARSLDDERVIAGCRKRSVQTAKQPARIMRNARHLA